MEEALGRPQEPWARLVAGAFGRRRVAPREGPRGLGNGPLRPRAWAQADPPGPGSLPLRTLVRTQAGRLWQARVQPAPPSSESDTCRWRPTQEKGGGSRWPEFLSCTRHHRKLSSMRAQHAAADPVLTPHWPSADCRGSAGGRSERLPWRPCGCRATTSPLASGTDGQAAPPRGGRCWGSGRGAGRVWSVPEGAADWDPFSLEGAARAPGLGSLSAGGASTGHGVGSRSGPTAFPRGLRSGPLSGRRFPHRPLREAAVPTCPDSRAARAPRGPVPCPGPRGCHPVPVGSPEGTCLSVATLPRVRGRGRGGASVQRVWPRLSGAPPRVGPSRPGRRRWGKQPRRRVPPGGRWVPGGLGHSAPLCVWGPVPGSQALMAPRLKVGVTNKQLVAESRVLGPQGRTSGTRHLSAMTG